MFAMEGVKLPPEKWTVTCAVSEVSFQYSLVCFCICAHQFSNSSHAKFATVLELINLPSQDQKFEKFGVLEEKVAGENGRELAVCFYQVPCQLGAMLDCS